MDSLKPRLRKALTRLSLLTAVAAVILPQGSPASASEWMQGNCVREPMRLDATNAARVRGIDCRITAVRAQLQGQEGYLHTYQFRDGIRIRVFIGNPSDAVPHLPHPVRFSVNRGDWLPGQFLELDLPHNCGTYSCNWSTVRDAQGRVVVATGVSI
ncbi:MAG: hypothetical protein Fur0042_14610 [Cyanophyceae cyanobacterium]